jgi:hypothetical protein
MSTMVPERISAAQISTLQRIRRISRPLTILSSVALGLMIIPVIESGALVLFHPIGSLMGYVSFSDWGVGLMIGGKLPAQPALVPLESLSLEQRLVTACLLLLCTACSALALLHLRGLFALYSRGVVFDADNALRIKKFGLWLALSSVAINLSGRIFTAVIHAPLLGMSNPALTVVCAAMIYVIGYVMELAREADLERKDFI